MPVSLMRELLQESGFNSNDENAYKLMSTKYFINGRSYM
jgi:hypothetical protein